jgi:hypothetical protein
MVNFELVFGNSYHNEPRGKPDPCEKAAHKKAALSTAGERCTPVMDQNEQPDTLV